MRRFDLHGVSVLLGLRWVEVLPKLVVRRIAACLREESPPDLLLSALAPLDATALTAGVRPLRGRIRAAMNLTFRAAFHPSAEEEVVISLVHLGQLLLVKFTWLEILRCGAFLLRTPCDHAEVVEGL